MESIKQSVADLYGGADAALSSLLRQLEERQDAAAAELTAWRALGPSPEAVRVELAALAAPLENVRRVLQLVNESLERAVEHGLVSVPEGGAQTHEMVAQLVDLAHGLMPRVLGGGLAPRSERDACETVARMPQAGDVGRDERLGIEHTVAFVRNGRVGNDHGSRPLSWYADGTLTFVRAAEPRKVEGLDAKEAIAAMEGGDCVHGDDAITRRMRNGVVQVWSRVHTLWLRAKQQEPSEWAGELFRIVPDPSKGGV